MLHFYEQRHLTVIVMEIEFSSELNKTHVTNIIFGSFFFLNPQSKRGRVGRRYLRIFQCLSYSIFSSIVLVLLLEPECGRKMRKIG